MRHVTVLGAGITGITTAYALLDRGCAVTVLDRHRYAGMETSFANGGQLSASNAEVWNSVGTIAKGLRWLLRADAPLRMGLRPSWQKLSWLAEFCAHVGDYRRNTVATTRLAIAARRALFDMAEREGIEFDLQRRGILHVYRDRAGFEHAAAVNELLTEGGLDRHAVTPEEMQAIEPALQGRYYGGFFTPSDATGDIHKFCRGLAQACVRRGATLLTEADIRHVAADADGVTLQWERGDETHDLHADAVVVCAGVASRRFAAMLGDRVPVYPVKGYSITVGLEDAASRLAAPQVSLLDDAAKIVSSRLGDGRLRVAGTAEFSGENRDIVAPRVRPLVDWTRRLFPGVDTDRVVPWAGLRPMLPDMLPRVAPGRRPGVFYNTGHGHLGWTLAAATAEMVADSVVGAAAARAPHRPDGRLRAGSAVAAAR